ncbi:hypothetical protein [Hahella sp. NBU794]|uniref:hypothetical protein n=1 Tax=Hahella sp. NBU794 TaxID=3422590 RepID=UPI003D6E6253
MDEEFKKEMGNKSSLEKIHGTCPSSEDNADLAPKDCDHDWEAISQPSVAEATEANKKLIDKLGNKASRSGQKRGYAFENRAIEDNLPKMNLVSAGAEYKCKKCGQDQEVDVVGDRQIGEAKSTNANQYKNKGKQRKRLRDIQSKLFDPSLPPRAKIDGQNEDHQELKKRYENSGFEVEVVN